MHSYQYSKTHKLEPDNSDGKQMSQFLAWRKIVLMFFEKIMDVISMQYFHWAIWTYSLLYHFLSSIWIADNHVFLSEQHVYISFANLSHELETPILFTYANVVALSDPQSDSPESPFIIKSSSGVWMSLTALGIASKHLSNSVIIYWCNAILASKCPLFLAGKAVMMLFKNDITYAPGALQLSAGQDAGVEDVAHYAQFFFPKKIPNAFY